MAMEYHLEKKLRFNGSPEFSSLYSWAINEIAEDGTVSRDHSPWVWGQAFTATELILSDSVSIKTEGDGSEFLPRREETTERRVIRAKLRPGESRRDGDWYYQTSFRMFGTDRIIEEFHLDILPLADASAKESCQAWAGISYTAGDFRDETEKDIIAFHLMLKPERFEHYARRITEGTVDELIIDVGHVEGFYAEWSPDIHTREVKVLARGKEQDVEMPPEVVYELPRIGPVGEVNLYINGVRKQPMQEVKNNDDDEPQPSPLSAEAAPAKPQAVTANGDPQTIKLLTSIKTAAWVVAVAAVVAMINTAF